MKRKTPLEMAAKELDNIRALLAKFEEKRTVYQHERLAYKIAFRTLWFNERLSEHLKAVRKTHAQRKHTKDVNSDLK